MRLFIAIPLPKYLRKDIEDYTQQFPHTRGPRPVRGRVQASPNSNGIKWTAPQNFHITVQFLGEVQEKHVEEIQKRLTIIAGTTKPFELLFQNITWAPPNKEPRMIWVNFGSDGQYDALVKKVSDAVNEFVHEHLHDEQVMRKVRHPHITLARLKNSTVAHSIKLFPLKLKKDTINVTSFELWVSELTPDGPVYNVLEKFLFQDIR